MACTIEENENAVNDMFEGTAPLRSVNRALVDAEIFVVKYGSSQSDRVHDMLIRYYACHLLYQWGFGARISSLSIDDISEAREALSLGDTAGVSSYLVEFHKLLYKQTSDFFLSV